MQCKFIKHIKIFYCKNFIWFSPEVEYSRTSLASRTSSRTHFHVLGLEASSSRKLSCLRLEDNTIFWVVKSLWSAWKFFWKTFFSGDCLKKFSEDLFFFVFEDRQKIFSEDLFCWRALALVSLVLGLGLEHSCPWPLEGLSSVGLSLALASDFFVSLASNSTSGSHKRFKIYLIVLGTALLQLSVITMPQFLFVYEITIFSFHYRIVSN